MGRAFEVRKQAMAKTGAIKSAIYGRASKEIYLAAKTGNSADPIANLMLKNAIDKAKANQVPSDVIKRAIQRFSGGEVANYLENRYEGYGPAGSMIIVDSLTTNVNRAVAEIRDAFNKNGGKLGNLGSVSFNFSEYGVLKFESEIMDVEQSLEFAVENDLDVVDVFAEDDITVIYTSFQEFNRVKKGIDQKVNNYLQAEIAMIANEYIKIEGEDLQVFNNLINKLNNLEDVQNIYHNILVN